MLKQNPPASIAKTLSAESIPPADVLLCTDTDIDRLGNYHPQWLVVTKDRVLMMQEDVGAQVILSLAMSEASEFRHVGAIGSGLLQARVGEMYVDILRYSNRLGDRFAKVARKLDLFLKGEPIQITPEDEADPRRCLKCGLMLEAAGDACPRCVDKGRVMVRMWKLMRPYRAAAVVMLLLLVFGIALDLVAPRLTQFMVDDVLKVDEAAIRAGTAEASPQALKLLLIVVGIFAAVQVLRMVVNIFQGRIASKVGTAVTFDMRGRLVDHLQKLSVGYYDRQQVGSLVGRVAYDTEALHSFVAQLTGGFLFQIAMVIGVGIMMFTINPKLALWTLVPAPFVMIGSVIFWRYIYPRYYRFWDASSKQAGALSGMLSGIRVVKAFSQEGRELTRFNKISDRLQQSRRNVDISIATFNPIMGLVFQFGGWIVWYVGGADVLRGHMTLGQLMAYLAYLWMFYAPLGALTQFTNWLTSFVTQAHRIFEILDAPIQIQEPKNPVSVRPIRGEIKFENVTFGYNRHSPVLRDLSSEIKPGELIGIVGRSGSGKTTFINLLCRFYDVNEGRVLIDGVDIRDIATAELRGQIGVVLQEPFLFRGSIWENLTYGLPDAPTEKVLEASKAGNCHDFIMRQSHGYDTWVGERGAGLSGGERQRISIARVLLTDPRILILDEATSSVDSESEAAIQNALAEVVRGRTTLAIAHRLSTLRSANRILVVDHGVIAESGTHDELVVKGGLYAKLVRIQGQHNQTTVDTLHEYVKDKEASEPPTDTIVGTSLPHIRSHHPRWLTPDIARIHTGTLGALHVTVVNERIYGGVHALRCMPVRYPREFISLRYVDGEKRETEVGLIRRLDEWPPEAQQLIRESLLKRYFVHTIRSIRNIETLSGYLAFDVETDLGPIEFMMRWQGDRAQDYGSGGKMLLDTDENRYLIPDVDNLPDNDRRLFLRFIYW